MRIPDGTGVVGPSRSFFVVGETFNGEVLAELAQHEVVATKLRLPVAVRLDLVNKHRAVLTAVAVSVGLVVAFDADPTNHASSLDRGLRDCSANDTALPGDFFWDADVDAKQAWHHSPPQRASIRAKAVTGWSPRDNRSLQYVQTSPGNIQAETCALMLWPVLLH